MSQTLRKELITIRLSKPLCDEARALATREGESQSMIFRRLIRRGLETERRSQNRPDGEAA